MNFRKVAVVLPVGYQAGIAQREDGLLVIAVKPTGEQWAHGIEPISGLNEIAEGCTRWVIEETNHPLEK